MKFFNIALIALALQSSLVLASEEGAKKFRDYNCTSCHGPQGIHPGLSHYPIIGGQPKEYVLQQLRDFRAGNRTHGASKIMNSIAKSIPESEFEALADYISSIKPEAPADAKILTGKGQEAFIARNCHTCHGPQGKMPIAPNYPVIAGQNPEYLLAQMRAIQSGERANGMSVVMKALIPDVTDEEFKLIATYLHSVR